MLKKCLLTLVLLILFIPGLPTSAGTRVIAEVEVITDYSARISLSWSDGSGSEGLMITSWRFEDEGRLVVYYRTDADLPDDYASAASRTISHETYTFPTQVHLALSGDQEAEFLDLSEGDRAYDAILNLYYRGIIGGYPDGTFLPANNVTRAEFSKMLLLTAGYETDGEAVTVFTDVAQDFWGLQYIMPLADRGILKGKGDSAFDPGGQIKIGEVLAVLTRTFDFYEGDADYPYALEDHWSNEAFLEAVSDGMVLPSDSFYQAYDPELPATREQCSVLLSRVLENLHDVAE